MNTRIRRGNFGRICASVFARYVVQQSLKPFVSSMLFPAPGIPER